MSPLSRLNGSYEAIDGGHLNDAIVDMTGGISERIDLEKTSKVPDNLFDLMVRTMYMKSMMGCSITVRIGDKFCTIVLFMQGCVFSCHAMLSATINPLNAKVFS